MNNLDASANLYRLIGGSSRELLLVNELEEAEAYKELAHATSSVSFLSSRLFLFSLILIC